MCDECFTVSGLDNAHADGDLTLANARAEAAPILKDCVKKGGAESALRHAFAWAYEPKLTAATPPAAPKRGRGRPRLGGDVATRTVGVRMSQADADALAAIAAAEQTTVAELLRPAIAAILAGAGPAANRTK